MKVAYQGVRGAYSEAAVLRAFGPRALPCGRPSSEEVVEAVLSGRAQAGLLPVENTIAGHVAGNSELLAEAPVFVFMECLLPIEHRLLAVPGARLSDIREVRSHPVALAQCRAFLERRGLKAVPEYDTAGAAELVARRASPREAAIAGELCARAYGLKVLARRVQSHRRNFTRFLAFRKGTRPPRGLRLEKTSLVFWAGHRPGALVDCLRCFSDRGLNLSRLESRPVPSSPFSYAFHADVLAGLGAAPLRAALACLSARAARVKVLGSYPLARTGR